MVKLLDDTRPGPVRARAQRPGVVGVWARFTLHVDDNRRRNAAAAAEHATDPAAGGGGRWRG